MLVQLMPSLVELVQRREEGTGISGVDFDRPFVSAHTLPRSGRAWGHRPARTGRPCTVTPRPSVLWNFSPLAPASKLARSRADSRSDQPGLVDPGKVNQGISQKSAGVGIVEGGERFFQSLVPSHRPDSRPRDTPAASISAR